MTPGNPTKPNIQRTNDPWSPEFVQTSSHGLNSRVPGSVSIPPSSMPAYKLHSHGQAASLAGIDNEEYDGGINNDEQDEGIDNIVNGKQYSSKDNISTATRWKG